MTERSPHDLLRSVIGFQGRSHIKVANNCYNFAPMLTTWLDVNIPEGDVTYSFELSGYLLFQFATHEQAVNFYLYCIELMYKFDIGVPIRRIHACNSK